MRGPLRKLVIWSCSAVSILLAVRLLLSRGVFSSSLTNDYSDETFPRTRFSEQQDARVVYAAGTYMAGRRPGNKSYCAWYDGLPEVLSYPPEKLASTPEVGEKSPFRVLSFVIRANERIRKLPQVTLCTHATADQVYGVVELARRWEGPLSLAVFAPGFDAGLAVALLDRACRCEPAMSKVSVHLIFPGGRPPELGRFEDEKTGSGRGDCAASDLQWRKVETERKQRHITYPINVARNVARTEATTVRVFVSDIELLPSDGLASGFIAMLRGRAPRVAVVFVVPVFEIEANENPPTTKRELLLAARSGAAVYFHKFLCPHCQRFPGLTRWMLRPDPGKVRPLIVAKREYPHHRWEPVFIGTREDPLYTEEMSWEGKQDKMAQMFEMCLLNYRLVVLDGAFLVHVPGIKRKPLKLNAARQEYFRPHERRNARIYQRVIKRLLKRYPINKKCKQ